MKKYTLEFAKKTFLNSGRKLLATEYKGAGISMKYECLECGYKGKTNLTHVLSGGKCKSCKARKHDINTARLWAERCGLILMEDVYYTFKTGMKYKCKTCGYEGVKKLKDLMRLSGCPKCAKVLKYTLNKAKKIFNDIGLILLESEYINSQTLMKYKCKTCNHKGKKTLYTAIRLYGCPKCAYKKSAKKQRKYNIKQCKKIFSKLNLKLLERDYTNNKTPMKYKCNICGYIGKMRINDAKYGHGCYHCGQRKSAFNRVYKKTINKSSKDKNGKYTEHFKKWAIERYDLPKGFYFD